MTTRLQMLGGRLSVFSALAAQAIVFHVSMIVPNTVFAVSGPAAKKAYAASAAAEPNPTLTPLKVQIYPWLPDVNHDGFASMVQRFKEEFSKENPDVELTINPSCFTNDVYDIPYVINALKGGDAGCDVDIVEMDMLALGDVVDSGAAQPWPNISANPPPYHWHPASISASTYQGQLYGVPHWMCTHFVFSRDSAVAKANSSADLIEALNQLGTPQPNLAGHYLYNWNTNALYLDAWADNHPGDPATAISETQLDGAVLASMHAVAAQCESGGVNHCLDGVWEEAELYDTPAKLFARKKADATFGYLELLNTIAPNLPGRTKLEKSGIVLNTLPLGEGNTPLMFTDGFVLSSRCTGACANAAQRFAAYMSRTSTMEWLLAAKDVPAAKRIPRYVLVANLDTYRTPSIAGDYFFRRANALTRKATRAFPNAQFYPTLDPMYDLILQGF
jgi:thiamine pyridinylase